MNLKENIIQNGQYVIFQRKDYKKLHLLSEKSNCVFLGKDKVNIDCILDKQIGSTFKLVPIKGCNRQFSLELCTNSDVTSAKELLKDIGCGIDNRSIYDDGSSQSLTSISIEELRDIGTAPKAIIEQLLENSKTFQSKTEYSQEKYIKKKEKKYFEYIIVHRPNIRLISEILYNREMPKTIGIRIDTLSQLTTTLNFQPDGNYLLLESGFNGIVAATLLNSLSDKGSIIQVTPGNQNQKQAVLAMNFPCSKLSQLITVRLTTLIDLIEKDKQLPLSEGLPVQNELKDNCKHDNDCNGEQQKDISSVDLGKRKYSNFASDSPELLPKKPRWAMDAEIAVEVLTRKVDGLVLACKEFPLNILDIFLDYLLPSRPFIVYSLYQEPLVAMYLHLKRKLDIVYLRITESWLRPHQVLPNRSHPAVTVSSTSGYLLSGIKVVNR